MTTRDGSRTGEPASPFRSAALAERRAFEEDEVSLSEPAGVAPILIVVAFAVVVAAAIVGLGKQAELTAVGPAVVDDRRLLAAVPAKYRNLIVPGQTVHFEVEGARDPGAFVTVGIEEGPTNLLILRGVLPAGAPAPSEAQYGQAVVPLGREPVLAKLLPVLESILVPRL